MHVILSCDIQVYLFVAKKIKIEVTSGEGLHVLDDVDGVHVVKYLKVEGLHTLNGVNDLHVHLNEIIYLDI